MDKKKNYIILAFYDGKFSIDFDMTSFYGSINDFIEIYSKEDKPFYLPELFTLGNIKDYQLSNWYDKGIYKFTYETMKKFNSELLQRRFETIYLIPVENMTNRENFYFCDNINHKNVKYGILDKLQNE